MIDTLYMYIYIYIAVYFFPLTAKVTSINPIMLPQEVKIRSFLDLLVAKLTKQNKP